MREDDAEHFAQLHHCILGKGDRDARYTRLGNQHGSAEGPANYVSSLHPAQLIGKVLTCKIRNRCDREGHRVAFRHRGGIGAQQRNGANRRQEIDGSLGLLESGNGKSCCYRLEEVNAVGGCQWARILLGGRCIQFHQIGPALGCCLLGFDSHPIRVAYWLL